MSFRTGAHRPTGLLRAALAAASLSAGSQASAASTEPAASPDATIVVTGSRISAPQVADLSPLVSLDVQYLDDRNLTNPADALNELPGFRGSVTPAGPQGSFGQGVNFINLYRLGSNRTLTLVNGRRVVTSNVPSVLGNANPGNQVDLNVIPAILIDRIETVSIGGATAYGSDAVAGTVNVILKRRLRGLEARGTVGVTGEGDGMRWNAALAGGHDFAGGRANISAAISYDRQHGVLANDRAFYRANIGPATNPCTVPQAGVCNAFNLVSVLGPAGRTPANDGRVNPDIGFNNTTSDGFPGSILIRDLRLAALTRGGLLSSGVGAYSYQFAPDGRLVPYTRGTPFGVPLLGPLAPASIASGGDGLALNDFSQITSALKRINAALSFTYELSDRVTFFADALYYDGKADELVQQPTFNATLFGGASGPLTFRTDNPFLSAQARQQLAALGYTSTFQLSRANADLADLTGWSRSRLYRAVAGIEGKFAVGDRDFTYQASINWSRNDFTDHGQVIDQQRFVNAINVTALNGQPACSLTPTVTGLPAGQIPVADPACVPLNLFGEGAASPAALAYILRDTVSRSRMEQVVAEANVGGSLFALNGNPVSVNLGYEHRAEKARFAPDPFLAQGLSRNAAVAATGGAFHLDELSAEALVPLVTPENRWPIARLDLFARLRHVMSNVNGAFTAWSAGGDLAPVEDVTFRGSYTRSFRAPSIVELYSPRSVTTTAVLDLCSAANINAGPAPDIRRANCAAFLARYPNATPLVAATASVPAYAGGNPNLANEVSDSFTYGVLIRPRWITGLTLSADYIDIDISGPISTQEAGAIAQGCFDNPSFDASDPANGNSFCSLIRRDASGQVIADPQNPGVTTGYVNGQKIAMSGVQFGFGWRPAPRLFGLPGQFEVTGQMFHLRRRLINLTGVAPVRSDGMLTDPRWQGQLRLRYSARDALGRRFAVAVSKRW